MKFLVQYFTFLALRCNKWSLVSPKVINAKRYQLKVQHFKKVPEINCFWQSSTMQCTRVPEKCQSGTKVPEVPVVATLLLKFALCAAFGDLLLESPVFSFLCHHSSEPIFIIILNPANTFMKNALMIWY